MVEDKPALERVEVAVEVARPSHEELEGFDRAQKYSILKQHHERSAEKLSAWVQERGLSEELFSLRVVPSMNLLFITTTQKVAELLRYAPGVDHVYSNPQLKVNLPYSDGKVWHYGT